MRLTILALLTLVLLATGCARTSPGKEEGHESGEEHGHAETVARGPNGGRLFSDDSMRLELLIVEDGVPPEFHAYVYDGQGRAGSADGVSLAVVLDRLGGRRDSIGFRPAGSYLRSTESVVEPHSYRATVLLERGGRSHEWTYEQEEGRVELVPEAVVQGGITTGRADARLIEVRVETPGEVRLNAERVVQVRPRYPGVVQSLTRQIGDAVRAGDLLATVQSNESLTDYEIRAPMGGTVVSREVAMGQSVDHESVLYTVADLSTVWVDFALYPQVAGQVRRGQAVHIRTESDPPLEAVGTVRYVGPLLEQDTRVSYGRVLLPNPHRRWPPGLYVTAAITVDRARAEVAVPEEAIVRTSRGPAVFRAEGTTFELQPVVPGRSDGTWTEITEGLEPGATIVTGNAFLLKAELGKSEASHEH